MLNRLFRKPLIAGVLALALMIAPIAAQTHTDKNGTIVPGSAPIPNLGTGAYSPVTVGTSNIIILAGGSAYYILDLVNNSSSATVCINIGAPATISGTACASGEITLPPLWHRSWEGSFIPTDAVYAIASAASTPFTVGVK